MAERVQSSLGIDAVLQPRLIGGRGVVERISFVPFGEHSPDATAAEASWPGAIPPPLPARIGGGIDHPAARVKLISDTARPVGVTAEALLTAAPCALGWGKNRYLVTGWAGPWPVDEGWWGEHPHKVARLQVVGHKENSSDPLAWLLLWSKQQWRVEALYN